MPGFTVSPLDLYRLSECEPLVLFRLSKYNDLFVGWKTEFHKTEDAYRALK